MRLRPTLALASSLLCLPLAPAAAQTVGVTAAVNQAARSLRPNAAIRTIALGDNVIHNERIETDKVGLLQILLADGTTFTVGPNSALAIDRFVYDPQAGTAKVAATLTKGVFRFIGGKTSKTPGGVSLGTPVGTIGIRGAVVDVNLDDGPGGRSMPTHVDMIFGDEVTLTAPNGRTDRIYEPGYSIVITAGADGTQSRSVQRTPPGFASAIQQSLAGGPGTSGGSPNRPSDGIVIASRIARENSDRTPAINNPPIPLVRPEPGRPGVIETALIQDAQLDLGSREIVTGSAGPQNGGAPGVPSPGPGDPGAGGGSGGGGNGGGGAGSGGGGGAGGGGTGGNNGDPPKTVKLRLLTAGATYGEADGYVVTDPGRVGLVGGSPQDDRTVELTASADGRTGTGTTNRGTLVLPLYDDTALVAHLLSASDGASLGGVPLVGTIYSGRDGFAAYGLALGGDPTRPVYGVQGTPLADAGVLQNGDVRRYGFTRDPLQDIAVPFLQARSLDTAGAAITDFYVVEPQAGTSATPQIFQSWLLIDGAGTQQQSAIGVNVGSIDTYQGALQLGFSRRGSYRAAADETSFQFFGGVGTYAAPGGGHQIFGSQGQYLVLGPDPSVNDSFIDAAADHSDGSTFGSFHLLSLASEVPLSAFVSQGASSRALAETDAIIGFASGLAEGVRGDGSLYLFPFVSGSDPGNVFISFDGERNRLGGEIDVGNADGGARAHVAFGDGVFGNRGTGNSTYVDDDMFAARQNANGNSYDRTYLRDTDSGGETIQLYPQITGQNPGTYLVSADAVPQPGLLPNGDLCACKFLEWGWWGTQVRASDNPATPNVEAIRVGIHLGNWVAGDITSLSELSTLAGTTASYAGHAVGTVITGDLETGMGARYIASGDMRMDWDFGQEAGSMAIERFDGRNFSGPVGALGNETQALFSGNLTEDNLDASGPVSGAFFNDGANLAAGVAGDFSLSSADTNWSAVGIVGGAKLGQ
jgi:hypothetical protein